MTTARVPLSVLAVTGLQTEARIAAGPGVETLAGGGDAAGLAERLRARLQGHPRAVISFGIAGGLAPGFAPGSILVADAVDDGTARLVVDAPWRVALLAALPNAVSGTLYGTDQPVSDTVGKAQLHQRTGALAVDMESHVAARCAQQSGVPFVALRVVADPAERSLPPAALAGMRPDGSMDALAVMRALARRPGDLPGLIRTALDAQAAFKALRACRARLGDRLGFPET